MKNPFENRSTYHELLRKIAVSQSARFGMDTPRTRCTQARVLRRLRREYPFNQYGITWD